MSGLATAVYGRHRFRGEDLHRARLIVITSVSIAASACVVSGLVIACDWGTRYLPPPLGAGIVVMSNLWLLRRTGRLELAAMTLCLTLLAGIAAVCCVGGGLSHPALCWTILIPLYAPRLLRDRLAAACIAVAILVVVALYAAEQWGHEFPPLPPGRSMIVVGQLVLAVLVSCLVFMYERARRDVLLERDTARAALEASGEARLALVENVAAVIFSVDRELHLIAGNSLFELLSHRHGQPPIRPGEPVLDGLSEAQHDDLRALFARAFDGEHFAVERTLELRSKTFECEILFNPIRRASGDIRGVTVFGRDISDRNRARAELERVSRKLAEAAHLAGKAEVATDVLHNVGNVLTALNSSADLVLERLRSSRAAFLGKTVALLPSDPDDCARFLSCDERGRQIPSYLTLLADALGHERDDNVSEMESVHRQLDHIKSVIARQQAFARASGAVEIVSIADLVASTIAIHATSFERHGIAVTSTVTELPLLALDRYKLVAILTNFLVNSRQSLDVCSAPEKRITVHAFRNDRGALQIDVVDNGVGIDPRQQPCLFTYGFTTKLGGHGFGLASSLLDARSMGGTASGYSHGPGTGATFTVELPFTVATSSSSMECAA